MPQHKHLKSLKAVCLDNIAENMDEFWLKHYDGNVLGCKEEIHKAGPFEYLPGCLVNEIIETLRKKRMLGEKQLMLLITSSLERLVLSCTAHHGLLVYDLISLQCKDSLKELRLSGCLMKAEELVNIFLTLRKLEVLDLSRTNVNDDSLCAVGSNCSRLRELDVSHSKRVTDEGIKYLCVDGLTGRDGVRRCGMCKLLSKLHIQRTKVGESGVEAALRHLPNLQYLDHPDVVSVLGRMHRADREAGVPIPPYRLRSLFAGDLNGKSFLSNYEFDKISLCEATNVCPHATDVHLVIERSPECPDALVSLCKLKNLKVLDLKLTGGTEFYLFSHAMTPALRTCGQSITALRLSGFRGVDVGIIGMCCPLLEELRITYNKSYADNSREELSSMSNGKPFRFLKILFILMCDDFYVEDSRQPNQPRDGVVFDIPPSHLKSLLYSPVLEVLSVTGSQCLSNGLLGDVLRHGQEFSHLRELRLKYCDCLTGDFVRSFLRLSGPLKAVFISRCNKVTQSDLGTFESFSKARNLDLDFFWAI